MADNDAFEDGITIFNNEVMGQEKPDLEKAKYADAPFVDEGKKLQDVRDKFAPNADKATTAAAKKGEKSLPKAVKEVDSSKQAQQMPELYQNSDQIMQLMSMGSGLIGMVSGMFNQGGGGGGMNNDFTMPSGVGTVLVDSITGALAILVRSHGFELVIRNFNNALADDKVNLVHPAWKPYLLNALGNLIKLGLYYGPLNIPVSEYNPIVYGVKVPDPLLGNEDLVPDYYLKTYYNVEVDPYPGYQEWVSPDGLSKVWVRKSEAQLYHFNSSSEEIYSVSERSLAADWNEYIFKSTLTVDIINWALARQVDDIQNNSMENNLGKNTSGGGNTNNMMNMMMGMLGGQLGQMLSMLSSNLTGGEEEDQPAVQSMDETTQKYKKSMAITGQILQNATSAVGGGGLAGLGGLGGLGGLSGLGGISGVLGGFGGGGLSGIMGGNLIGGFGSFGGSSGGGGGGAGSGFTPGTGGGSGFSEYTGGDVSSQGLSDIATLLRLLGLEEDDTETTQ